MARGAVQTSDAAAYLGVDRRTALDDLKALVAHGVPLSHPTQKGGKTSQSTEWRLSPAWTSMGIDAGLHERLAMLLGREVLGHFLQGTELAEGLIRLDRQLEAMTDVVDDRHISRRFYLKQEPTKTYAGQSELVSGLVNALVKRCPISFDYVSARNSHKRHFRQLPVTLVIYRRGLYIAVWRPRADVSAGERRVLHFAVDRMSDLEQHFEDDPFQYPPPEVYDPRVWFGETFGIYDDGRPAEEVVLRFPADSAQAYARERVWMPDQTLHARDDGSLELRFTARGAELAYRILEYGPHCEVIAPASLRARVAELARATAARYAGPGV
jgi:predicted DNA-binding transcriptional regulator YafY